MRPSEFFVQFCKEVGAAMSFGNRDCIAGHHLRNNTVQSSFLQNNFEELIFVRHKVHRQPSIEQTKSFRALCTIMKMKTCRSVIGPLSLVIIINLSTMENFVTNDFLPNPLIALR